LQGLLSAGYENPTNRADAVILNSDDDFGYIEKATEGRVRQEYVPT